MTPAHDPNRIYRKNMGYTSEFWRIRTMGKKPSPKTSLLSPECGSIALRGKFVTQNVTFNIHFDPFSQF